MSICSNVTEQDLINLRKLAEEQKNQRALKIRNRFFNQTHDIRLAEKLSPITKKVDVVNETSEQLGEKVKKSEVEDGNTQTPAIENILSSSLLRDTLTLMKRSKSFSNQKGKIKVKYFGMMYSFVHSEKTELVLKIKNLI